MEGNEGGEIVINCEGAGVVEVRSRLPGRSRAELRVVAGRKPSPSQGPLPVTQPHGVQPGA